MILLSRFYFALCDSIDDGDVSTPLDEVIPSVCSASSGEIFVCMVYVPNELTILTNFFITISYSSIFFNLLLMILFEIIRPEDHLLMSEEGSSRTSDCYIPTYHLADKVQLTITWPSHCIQG